MKQTEISYVETYDGKILIKEVKNVASRNELSTIDHEAVKAYFDGKHCYEKNEGGVIVYSKDRRRDAYPGCYFTKEDFGDLVATMKAAGSLWRAIVRHNNESRVKVIKI